MLTPRPRFLNVLKKSMRLKPFSPLALLAVLLFSGCQTPPTNFEKRFMNVETNYVPQVHWQTNTVPVYTTNLVTVLQTNIVAGGPPQVVTLTNEQRIVTFQTNVALVTVTNEQYRLTPNDTAKQIETIGGTVGNLFGVGGVVSTALAGIFGAWASFRSSRRYQTAATIAQNVQDIRSFIQKLPNGAAYDAALTKWIAAHQAEAGVTDQVLQLLQNEVSNQDAQYAAEQIRNTIAALQGSNPSPLAQK
jgi:hypothetical protein